jgi:hypothetical protein
MDLNGFTPSRRVVKRGHHYQVFVKPPKIVGDYPEVDVMLTEEQYQRYLLWREGPLLIQDALPELSPSTREMLMTGLCDADFQKLAADPEE